MDAMVNFSRLVFIRMLTVLDFLSPLFQLALRFYVAIIFFKSGLTKIQDFSSTIALFETEYKVPFISPTFAAYSGTAAELILPGLLVVGLATRPTAIALFVFNIVACIAYPDISEAGIKDHLMWGTILLVTVFYGPGRLSVDHFLKQRYGTL